MKKLRVKGSFFLKDKGRFFKVITVRPVGDNRYVFGCRELDSEKSEVLTFRLLGLLDAMEAAASVMRDPKDVLLVDLDNQGKWKIVHYGMDLKERERGMIEDCDFTIAIWTDNSGVIAENLELLKNLGKPTFLYEHSTRTNTTEVGWLDPKRTYDSYYHMKEYFRKKKQQNRQFVSYHGGL